MLLMITKSNKYFLWKYAKVFTPSPRTYLLSSQQRNDMTTFV